MTKRKPRTAPYDWSISECEAISGTNEKRFKSFLNDVYLQFDAVQNTYGIPSEIGGILCAYCSSKGKSSLTAENHPDYFSFLRNFIKEHERILSQLQKSNRGKYEKSIAAADPDYQFLSTYPAFIEQFSEKFSVILSIVNDFPSEQRPFFFKQIINHLDTLTEELLLWRNNQQKSGNIEPFSPTNVNIEVLLKRLYEKNEWRKDLQTLQSVIENLPAFNNYEWGPTESWEKLRIAFEQEYHQQLLNTFLRDDEKHRAYAFIENTKTLKSGTPQDYRETLRYFFYHIYNIAPSISSILNASESPSDSSSCPVPPSSELEICSNISMIEKDQLLDALFHLIQCGVPPYLQQMLPRITASICASFFRRKVSFDEANHTLHSSNYGPTGTSSSSPGFQVGRQLYDALAPFLPTAEEEKIFLSAATHYIYKNPFFHTEAFFPPDTIMQHYRNYQHAISALQSNFRPLTSDDLTEIMRVFRLNILIHLIAAIEESINQYVNYYEEWNKTAENTLNQLKCSKVFEDYKNAVSTSLYHLLFAEDQIVSTPPS